MKGLRSSLLLLVLAGVGVSLAVTAFRARPPHVAAPADIGPRMATLAEQAVAFAKEQPVGWCGKRILNGEEDDVLHKFQRITTKREDR